MAPRAPRSLPDATVPQSGWAPRRRSPHRHVLCPAAPEALAAPRGSFCSLLDRRTADRVLPSWSGASSAAFPARRPAEGFWGFTTFSSLFCLV